ncbi:VOC family protein [Mobilicoccus sp.]|uniref:VOC family protein n=1 Tax=Mobilicoccus sp. TaxID=2034349 RepID=UPI0028AAE894|nr:VOC family protein [Mobilicoccus sp.]
MPVITVFAVAPSSDLPRSRVWWTRLLGREPDRVPMPSDVEWHFPGGGGLQLVDDAAHAGAGSVTLGVDDIEGELAAIRGRGLEVPDAQTVPSGQFRIAMLNDPDGNTVVLAQTLAN